jgi:phosphoglycerate dehydrogenase-like enzyme
MQIVVDEPILMEDRILSRLHKIVPDLDIIVIDRKGNANKSIAEAEVLFRINLSTSAITHVLQQMPRLKWMHTASAGIDFFWPAFLEYAPADAILTNGSGVMSLPIAEYCLGQIYAVSKGFVTYTLAQAKHQWLEDKQLNQVANREVQGSHILILGTGKIGSDLACLCHGVGMHVSGIRRHRSNEDNNVYFEKIYSIDEDWRSTLSEVDFVALSLPLTPETHHLISSSELALMKQTAWIINISRGDIIDQAALINFLQENPSAGAILDVTTPEPLSADNELWTMQNVIITPHISWRSDSIDRRMMTLFSENLYRYYISEPLQNVIPREQGY